MKSKCNDRLVRKIVLCSRATWWAGIEVDAVIAAVRGNTCTADSLTAWAMICGYQPQIMPYKDGSVDLVLHKGCCRYLGEGAEGLVETARHSRRAL